MDHVRSAEVSFFEHDTVSNLRLPVSKQIPNRYTNVTGEIIAPHPPAGTLASTPLPGEAGHIVRGEPEAGCGNVLFQVGEAAGAGDGEHHRGGCQQGGERDLRGGRPVPGGGLPSRVVSMGSRPPPSGKNGTKAVPVRAHSASNEAGSRFQAGVRAAELGLAH